MPRNNKSVYTPWTAIKEIVGEEDKNTKRRKNSQTPSKKIRERKTDPETASQ